VQGTAVSIALQPDDGSIRDLGSDGVLFTLHGLGRGGQIVGEPASTARHALLRREALELALYSFRYLDGIREVVTLLPPTNPKAAAKAEKGAAARATAKEKSQQQAVLFQPGDLVRYLHAPLARTIAPGRLSPQALTAGQTQAIDRLTLPNLFLASLQIAQNQKLYMVLARPGASSASSASSSSSSSSGG
jgi:hypothetical protein